MAQQPKDRQGPCSVAPMKKGRQTLNKGTNEKHFIEKRLEDNKTGEGIGKDLG